MTELDLYKVTASDLLQPFGTGPVVEPPPVDGPRQIIGLSLPSGGASFNPPSGVNQAAEEQRWAAYFGWDNNGPPVQRIFRQQQFPPWSFLDRVANDGRIAWMSLKPSAGGVKTDVAGDHDDRWEAWGDYLKDYWPQEIWFTYDHENDRFSHYGGEGAGSPGWVEYQEDTRDAFVRAIGIMRSRDTTHGLDHVTFARIQTGWGYRKGSNRDPGRSWHPDMDVMAVDPYDFWMRNTGNGDYDKRGVIWSPVESPGSGFRHAYEFAEDPLQWYADYHPDWDVPPLVLANLDKFPTRIAIGETGTQFDMYPNGTNTQWIPRDDPEDPDGWQAAWLVDLGETLRTKAPRCELTCYWPSSDGAIGQYEGFPNYFFGPTEYRWGAYWQASIDAFESVVTRDEHRGALTPWTPTGLRG